MKKLKKAFLYIVLLTLLLWVGGYGAFLMHIRVIGPKSFSTKTDAIIVLTGGNYRITTGLELYAAGLSDQLFITGVHNLVKEEEIKAMWKGPINLPECCITLGRDATSTVGNAKETLKWAQRNNIKTIRLVTSPYHMPRSMLEFKHLLKGTEIISHPVDNKNYGLTDIKYLKLSFLEYNKTLFRWIVLTIEKFGDTT